MERILNSWAALGSHFIGDCFDLLKPKISDDFDGFDKMVRFVIAQLFIDCHLSSESILILIGSKKSWDADIISRSVVEGSLKLMYLLDGTDEAALEKSYEYWNVLPLFSEIRHSEKARILLNMVDDPDGVQWKPIKDLVVSDERVAEIRKKYSKSERKKLEEKWYFSGLCQEFSNSGNEVFRSIPAIAHGYGMSSHLIHKDADGVSVVLDRCQRSPDDAYLIEMAHSARIVSDVCVFSKLRAISILSKIGEDISPIYDLADKYEDALFSQLEKARHMFSKKEYEEATKTCTPSTP